MHLIKTHNSRKEYNCVFYTGCCVAMLFLCFQASCCRFDRSSEKSVRALPPLGVEKVIMAKFLNIVKITDVHQLAYVRKSYGDVLILSATFEQREGRELLYHQDFALVKKTEIDEWQDAELYLIANFSAVNPPGIWDLIAMPYDEMMAWLVDMESVSCEYYAGSDMFPLNATPATVTHGTASAHSDFESHGKSYEELSEIMKKTLEGIGGKYDFRDEADSWWVVLPKNDAQAVTDYIGSALDVAGMALEVRYGNERKLHVIQSNGSSITVSEVPSLSKTSYLSFDDLNKRIYLELREFMSPDYLEKLLQDHLNASDMQASDSTSIVLNGYLTDVKTGNASAWIWYPSEFMLRRMHEDENTRTICEIEFLKTLQKPIVKKAVIRKNLRKKEASGMQ